MIALYLILALVAWSGVCFVAGQMCERKRVMREDYNNRDQWAEDYRARTGDFA